MGAAEPHAANEGGSVASLLSDLTDLPPIVPHAGLEQIPITPHRSLRRRSS